MALYEITTDNFVGIPQTTFGQSGFFERGDLQRLLKKQIGIILPDLLVIAEEFGEWDDSRRRIDLLAIDRIGNLVVIELKRTDDGGHMELQAIRYAAMVSEMTFETAVETFGKYLQNNRLTGDPRELILDFLGWSEPDEARFAQDTRIVLISADFSKELTTAVMWLSVKKELDIRCIRLVPYADNGRTLVDVQQIIPLPEAADYQVKIKKKEQSESEGRAENTQLFEFWSELLAIEGGAPAINARMSPSKASFIGASAGKRGITIYYVANKEDQRVEVYIDRGDAATNTRIFEQFQLHRAEIEEKFGGQLSWEGLIGKRACRIAYRLPYVGNRKKEADWPAIHSSLLEAMRRFEPVIAEFVPLIEV